VYNGHNDSCIVTLTGKYYKLWLDSNTNPSNQNIYYCKKDINWFKTRRRFGICCGSFLSL